MCVFYTELPHFYLLGYTKHMDKLTDFFENSCFYPYIMLCIVLHDLFEYIMIFPGLVTSSNVIRFEHTALKSRECMVSMKTREQQRSCKLLEHVRSSYAQG